jgi:hypothetical protein
MKDIQNDAPGPKEVLYNEKLVGLVAQIHDICRADGVDYLIHFKLDGDLRCSSGHGTFNSTERHAMKLLGMP